MKSGFAFWVRSCFFVALATLATVVSAQNNESDASKPSTLSDRKIMAEDVLEIVVVGEKDWPSTYAVLGTGEISVPYLEKPVKVSGKSTTEVKNELEALWKVDIFVNPQVLVRVLKARARMISVDGKVNKPGLYEMPGEQRLDILAAIAYAGGLAPTANENKIEFTRLGQQTRKFTLKELRAIVDPTKKIFLEPDDKIYVHESVF